MNKCLKVIFATSVALLSTHGLSDPAAGTEEPGAQNARLPYSDVHIPLAGLGDGYLRTGRFVEVQKLAQMSPGTDEQKVTTYLGMPYAKGQFPGGQAWEYHINLPITDADHLVCQYQVVFDGEQKVSGIHWRRPQCEILYDKVPKLPTEIMLTSADVLFDFASARLSQEGQRELDQMAQALLNNYKHPRIWVVAHTDRIGSEGSNQILSELRAHSIGSYLISRGVPATQIALEGRGKSQPVVNCPGSQVTPALKECLAPNRRAQIEVVEMEPKRDDGYSATSAPESHN